LVRPFGHAVESNLPIPHYSFGTDKQDHLDLETTEALIESIRNFQGGVLLVSHDQHLLTSVCKDLYVVDAGSVEKLNKGSASGLASDAFKAYKKAVIQGKR
jgi:ATP-binding cassette, subfamily F, member 3